MSIAPKLALLSVTLLLFSGCRDDIKLAPGAEGEGEGKTSSPLPAAPPLAAELERIETGLQLGRGVVLRHQDAPPHLVVSNFSRGELLNIGGQPDPQTLSLSSKPIRALYALNEDKLLALETGGSRLFSVSLQGETLRRDSELSVCAGPRLAAPAPAHNLAWIVCRDPDAALVKLNLSPLSVSTKLALGGTIADVAALPEQNLLLITDLTSNLLRVLDLTSGSEIRAISLPPEPLRIVISPTPAVSSGSAPAPQRVWITHANGDRITAINYGLDDVERPIELGAIPSEVVPSPNGLYLYVLSAGSGRLFVVSTNTMSILQRQEVPVGASSLAWVGAQSNGSLLMSSGPRGHLWAWRAAGERLSNPQRLPVGAATGHISVGQARDSVWVTCPQAGRAVRFSVP